jgi:hypothetical protein
MKILSCASRKSVVLGSVLFLIHAIISWKLIIVAVETPYDAQWELIWLRFWMPDFPISLLHVLALILIPNFNVPFLPGLTSDFDNFLSPAFVYGVLGPAWYFSIPVIISHLINSKKRPLKT